MSGVLKAISQHARCNPSALAMRGHGVHLTYKELRDAVRSTANTLRKCLPTAGPIALIMDNDPAWILIDLACAA